MSVLERIANILDDRDITDGELRVLVNDATNSVTLTINPNSDRDDYYQVINMEDIT